ncbi:hypothetical protein GEMRC1_011597 [Eukaryota sp. GEM-RC1]
MSVGPVLVGISTFATLSFTSEKISADIVFPAISLLNILRFPLTVLPRVITGLLEGKVTMERAQSFLIADEVDEGHRGQESDNHVIRVENASFQWDSEDDAKFLLKDINFSVKKGELFGIISSVGQGKSSLVNAILGEMKLLKGIASITTKNLQFLPQEPWLIAGTVLENITLGSPDVSDEHLKNSLKISCLEYDLELFPSGIHTEIGSNGITLSGGQKARVAMARALYRDPDVLVMDDTYAALDAHVARRSFDLLVDWCQSNSKTLVFATNNVALLQRFDQIVVLESGSISSAGNFEYLKDNSSVFNLLFKTYVSDDHTTDNSPDQAIEKAMVHSESNVKIELVKSEERTRVAADFTLSAWTSDDDATPSSYLNVYLFFAVLATLFILVRSLLLARSCIAASTNLHKGLLSRILSSKLSFFDETPMGRILNRFAKDVDSLDRTFLLTLSSFFMTVFHLFGIVVVIALVLPVFLLSLPVILIFYIYFLHFYRRASRELKRLEAVTRSPLYSSFAETLAGLPVIRASNIGKYLKNRNQTTIDSLSSATFAVFSANRWLGLRLDILSALIVSGIAYVAVLFDLTGSQMGLVLSYSFSISGWFTWLVRAFIEVEQGINSVDRIVEFSRIPTEKDDGAIVEGDWPSEGRVDFNDVTMRYREDLPLVLKKLDFTVEPKSMQAIVGRTGSGKSSTLNVLLRLVELESGNVTIDGLDIREIALSQLRKSLFVLPQDTFLFTDSIRNNIDIFSKFSDEQIWDVLKKVELDTFISSLPGQLDYVISKQDTFSTGQRQLVSFAALYYLILRF